jgi:hypothetical protein
VRRGCFSAEIWILVGWTETVIAFFARCTPGDEKSTFLSGGRGIERLVCGSADQRNTPGETWCRDAEMRGDGSHGRMTTPT